MWPPEVPSGDSVMWDGQLPLSRRYCEERRKASPWEGWVSQDISQRTVRAKDGGLLRMLSSFCMCRTIHLSLVHMTLEVGWLGLELSVLRWFRPHLELQIWGFLWSGSVHSSCLWYQCWVALTDDRQLTVTYTVTREACKGPQFAAKLWCSVGQV